jgi:hypothetical protein
MENEKETPVPESETEKTARLVKAYELSQKILGEFYALTGISGLIAQGTLVYLTEIAKADLQSRITVKKDE